MSVFPLWILQTHFLLCRLCEEAVLDDLAKLKSRVAELKTKVENETEIKQQTQSFLEV